jgi:hypothetical protein
LDLDLELIGFAIIARRRRTGREREVERKHDCTIYKRRNGNGNGINGTVFCMMNEMYHHHHHCVGYRTVALALGGWVQ